MHKRKILQNKSAERIRIHILLKKYTKRENSNFQQQTLTYKEYTVVVYPRGLAYRLGNC